MTAGEVYNIIREIDQKLREATLSCRVVAENRGKSPVSEWFGETLAEGLAGAGVVAQPATG